jgi:hypothetical protein
VAIQNLLNGAGKDVSSTPAPQPIHDDEPTPPAGPLTPDSILRFWAEMRRHKYKTVVDVQSSGNLTRLIEVNADKALEEDPVLAIVDKADKAAKAGDKKPGEDFLKGSYAMAWDFEGWLKGYGLLPADF